MKNKYLNPFVFLTVSISIISASLNDTLPGQELAVEFSHIVQLSPNDIEIFYCGGSIIHPRVILTAGNCVDDLSGRPTGPSNTLLVTAGKLWLKEKNKTEEGEQTRTVAHYEVYPDNQDDREKLALLFLTEPFNITEQVQPIQLPSSNQSYSKGTVTSWGLTNWDNESVPQLNKFDLDLKKPEECNKESVLKPNLYKVTVTGLCAILKKESGICEITIGSSLTCQEQSEAVISGNIETSERSVLCGIATWGQWYAICGEKIVNLEGDVIDLFKDVSKYLDWIQGRIKENLKNCSGDLFDCGIGQETRCIHAEKKCNGVKDYRNGFDENEVFCGKSADSSEDVLEETSQVEISQSSEKQWRVSSKSRCVIAVAGTLLGVWLLAIVCVARIGTKKFCSRSH